MNALLQTERGLRRRPETDPLLGPRRWCILAAGTLLQLCLGTVYAWSYFQEPLMRTYGWTHAQVSWTFSLAICFLGLTAAWGGTRLPRFGPRRLAVLGGLLFGLGYLLAAVALWRHWLPLLYLGYGLVGGCGLGLGYVTPVATVARWFPDKKGLATGIVIMGFGLGAALMTKVLAPVLVSLAGGNFATVFAWLGVALGGLCMLMALVLANPPGQDPRGALAAAARDDELTTAQAVCSRRFLLMWGIFFCNILAGISIIGFQAPLFQDLWRSIDPALPVAALAAYGATLIAASSLFNGLGRMLWGGLSDRLGRLATFRIMLASQIVAFALLAATGSPWVFGTLVCYVLLCYGGGFGTAPALVSDSFAVRSMAGVYGVLLTAWSAAGIAGPQIVAFLKDRYGPAAGGYSFRLACGFVTVGLLLSLLWKACPECLPHSHYQEKVS